MRGKTIECISLIGLAVGPEKFTADASEVMEMLLKTQTGDAEMSDDDPQVIQQFILGSTSALTFLVLEKSNPILFSCLMLLYLDVVYDQRVGTNM